jgi:serine/threonine protein kinase
VTPIAFRNEADFTEQGEMLPMDEPIPRPIGPMPDGPFPQGFGRYELTRRLGQGGMGTVYLAQDRELDLLVALKVPHPDVLARPLARERFLREARSAARLAHPNLAWALDVNRYEGVDYLAMRYVPGVPLSEVPPGEVFEAVATVRTIALAMAAAHRVGVIHRDLKPANVIVTPEGEPVIVDFGLAMRVDPEDPRITADGAAVGTPLYMAPEQFWGEGGVPGDVYSLGVILYEMLAGRPPFEDTSVSRLRQRVEFEPPEPPSSRRPGLDPAVDAICLKALAKRTEERFADMDEFAAVLGAHLSGSPTGLISGGDPGKRSNPDRTRVRREAIRFAFVGMGELAPIGDSPRDRLYLDVGNRLRAGAIDHHQDAAPGRSNAGLVLAHPELVAGSVNPRRGLDDPFTIVLHAMPDLDCIASAYLAIGLLADGVLPGAAEALAYYVSKVDEGSFGLSRNNPFSLYSALMQRSSRLMRLPWNSDHERWRQVVVGGLAVVEYALQQVLTRGIALPEVDAFACPDLFEPDDRREVEADLERYRRKLDDPRTHARQIRLALPGRYGGTVEVEALLVRDVQNPDDPESCLFFKDWARSDGEPCPEEGGFAALCVSSAEGPRRPRRSILSVTPGCGATLLGLGERLDEIESARRKAAYGEDDRVVDPASGEPKAPRPGYANADPWYDGRAHGHTIVDSPRSGTLLTADEVEATLLDFGAVAEGDPLPDWAL